MEPEQERVWGWRPNKTSARLLLKRGTEAASLYMTLKGVLGVGSGWDCLTAADEVWLSAMRQAGKESENCWRREEEGAAGERRWRAGVKHDNARSLFPSGDGRLRCYPVLPVVLELLETLLLLLLLLLLVLRLDWEHDGTRDAPPSLERNAE
jgi:hypothetical protein